MSGISNEQAQELMDTIVAKCEELELEPEAILDGLGRVLLSAANTFGTKQATITIENVGVCHVTLDEAS